MENPSELAAIAEVLVKKQVAGAEPLKLAVEIPMWMAPLHDSGCEEGGWDKCRYDVPARHHPSGVACAWRG